MTVSVIIPTHNRAHMLTRALDSVIRQTIPAEVIVVDDASSDHTPRVLEEYPAVRMLRSHENVGGAAARNLGVAHSTGQLIAFLDSDDEWLPDKLERQVPLFDDRPELGAVYCRHFGQDDLTGVRSEQHPVLHRGWIRPSLLSGYCPHTTSLFVVRRQAFESVGGFDEGLAGFQDTDLWIRMSESWEFDAVDQPLVIVHSHEGPRVTTDPSRRAAAVDAFLDKWGAEMEDVIGVQGVERFRRNKLAVAHGAKVLGLVQEGRRSEAWKAFTEYARIAGVSRPRQMAGLLVSLSFGSDAHTSVKRWTQSA